MSVTAAAGFAASAASAGIKASGPDVALVACAPVLAVPAAGVFTTNKAAAAPVVTSRDHLRMTGGRVAAVLLNSGNANAATGERGMEVARRSAETCAGLLGCEPSQVLVCSTGLIGIDLDFGLIQACAPGLVGDLAGGPEAAGLAARAIMTTDTVQKEAVARGRGGNGEGFVVGGMAKGAAMISPQLATMLAVITTDAELSGAQLDAALAQAVAGSFNSLSLDGCQSTNDTVILLASGRAGRVGEQAFGDALASVCGSLAGQMAADAEGSTKTATITVQGALSDEEAAAGARKVAGSALVKCSLNGADPYWGRVVSELGSAGIAFELDRVSLSYGGVLVCSGGRAAGVPGAAGDARTRLQAHMEGHHIEIVADLGLGPGRWSFLMTDLGPGYIEENRRTS